MKLLFDVGNSSIKWARAEGDKLLDVGDFNYESHSVTSQFNKYLPATENEQISHILISNVGTLKIQEVLRDWVSQDTQFKIWQATVCPVFEGLKNAYPEPEQMGVDRWLAMIAAWSKYKTDLCIVDCGTALTIDIIEKSGQHLGGYIIPGVELMQESLVHNTERINVSIEKKIFTGPADNTQAAINSGACLAVTSAINRVVRQIENQIGTMPVCLITGGMADIIRNELEVLFKHEPNLILEGLLLSHSKLK